MELVKNIFFNTDKIVENTKLKISYVGTLYQEQAEEVTLHYGFGPDWDNVTDVTMEKTELGFQCEIDITDGETLNLCFKDGFGNWDNNNGENYTFTIEKYEPTEDEIDTTETSLVEVKDNGMQIHKGLRKTYIWSKKVRIAVYKLIKFFPKIISGNYKRKITDEQ